MRSQCGVLDGDGTEAAKQQNEEARQEDIRGLRQPEEGPQGKAGKDENVEGEIPDEWEVDHESRCQAHRHHADAGEGSGKPKVREAAAKGRKDEPACESQAQQACEVQDPFLDEQQGRSIQQVNQVFPVGSD